MPKINLREYKDISTSFSDIYGVIPCTSFESLDYNLKARSQNKFSVKKDIDFSLLISSLPKSIITNNTFTNDIKELIINLSFVYDLGILELENIVRSSINEKGVISKVQLRKNARNYYQFENNMELPSLIYKSQPEYLISSNNGITKKDKMIHSFETLTPYQFLKGKQNNVEPSTRDLKLLENLIIDYELTPGVVNVLVDYVLKIKNSRLDKSYIETIASQWRRLNIKTVEEAVDVAQKEYRKFKKRKEEKNNNNKNVVDVPDWLDKNIEKVETTDEEKQYLEDLLKEFR